MGPVTTRKNNINGMTKTHALLSDLNRLTSNRLPSFGKNRNKTGIPISRETNINKRYWKDAIAISRTELQRYKMFFFDGESWIRIRE